MGDDTEPRFNWFRLAKSLETERNRLTAENAELRRERDDYRSRLEASFARENKSNARILEMERSLQRANGFHESAAEKAYNAEARLAEVELLVLTQADALAEIKASVDGESDQPIKDIVYGCISEIAALKGER